MSWGRGCPGNKTRLRSSRASSTLRTAHGDAGTPAVLGYSWLVPSHRGRLSYPLHFSAVSLELSKGNLAPSATILLLQWSLNLRPCFSWTRPPHSFGRGSLRSQLFFHLSGLQLIRHHSSLMLNLILILFSLYDFTMSWLKINHLVLTIRIVR